MSRLGSSINSAITPVLFNPSHSYPFFLPTFVGMLSCVFSWLSGLGMIWMDKESDRREGKIKDDLRSSVIDESE